MVSVNVPLADPLVVLTVRVDDPDVVMLEGLNDPESPLGSPARLSETVPVKPPDGVIVTV